MIECTSCGSELAADTRFCEKCGNAVVPESLVGIAKSNTIEVIARSAPTWYVTFATGQTGGPFAEDAIQSMIAHQQIKITDSVIAAGGTTWVPITQSPFARFIVNQANVDRLAASTCPRCGAAMAVVRKNSALASILIIVGIFFTIAIIGIPLIIIGIIMRRRIKVAYQCPRCNFRT